jgi:MFS family permease
VNSFSSFRQTLVAFQHRNFRLFWFAQLVSFSGSTMQTAGLLWHVSLLAKPEQKAMALGLVGLVRVLPVVGLSLVGGVVADAHDRRRLMLVTQSVMTALAGLLAWVTFSGQATLGLVYLLAAATAAAGAFDAPARASLVPNLVPREHLPNAISLNTVMMQAASVVGPTLAGIAIANLGVASVYAVNAISFLAMIVALAAMRGTPKPVRGEAPQITWHAVFEGVRFVFRAPTIRGSMLLDFFATFFSSAMALLPIFAQDILHVGARGYGWLYAAPSVGAIAAGLFMVHAVDRIERRGRLIFHAVFAYGLATAVFGISRNYALTFLCLAATGAADMVSMVLRNLIRQLETPDVLRGRMTSVNMVFFMGGPQLGEFEAGLVGQILGAPFSVVSGGVLCIAACAWIAVKTPELWTYRVTAARAPAAEKLS